MTFHTLQTRRKLGRVRFRNDFWDRYWARASQLLANFFPCLHYRSQQSLRKLTRPSFLIIFKVANTTEQTFQSCC